MSGRLGLVLAVFVIGRLAWHSRPATAEVDDAADFERHRVCEAARREPLGSDVGEAAPPGALDHQTPHQFAESKASSPAASRRA